MKKPIPAILAVSALALTGCTNPQTGENPIKNTQEKAAIGALLGAIVGAATAGENNQKEGAIIGGFLGGVAGGVYGQQLDKQEAELRRDLGNDQVQITNTGQQLIVTMPQDILFALDSADLRPDLQMDLIVVSNNLQAYPNTTVQIIGHTDNTGDAGYNQNLSERRALSVAKVFINNGVSPTRLHPIGRGENAPIYTNLTAEGRSKNRRVELIITPIAQ